MRGITSTVIVLFCAFSQQQAQASQKIKQPRPMIAKPFGRVGALRGKPTIVRGGKEHVAKVDEALHVADEISTPADSKIRINLTDGSILALGSQSRVTLTSYRLDEARRGSISVTIGKFWMQVAAWAAGPTHIEVFTPSAVAGIRGTTLWGDTDVDAICALEGHVEVRSRRAENLQAAEINAGQCVAELKQGKLTPLQPTQQQVQSYLRDVLIADE